MFFAKRKKEIILASLIFVMLCLIFSYYFIKDRSEEKEEAELTQDKQNISLSSFQTDDIVQINYQNSSAIMTLIKQDKKWEKKEDKNFPVDQEKVEEIIQTASSLSANRLVTKNAENLEQYGLLSPEVAVSFVSKDNQKVTFYLGNKVPSGEGGRYLVKDDETTIYTVDETYYTIFSYTENQMLVVENIPSFNEENILRLSVQKKDKTIFKLEKNKEKEASSDYYYWQIVKPYEEPVIGDTNNLTTLFSYYGGLSYDECVEYLAKDLSKYGLENPNIKIELTYTKRKNKRIKEKQFVLLIGKKDKIENYYVKSENSKAVYLMSSSKINSLLPASIYDYINHSLVLESSENVNKINFTIQKNKYEMRREITKGKEGEEKSICYFNNKEIEATSYLNVFQTILDLQTAKEIEKKADQYSVYMEIIIYAKSAKQNIRFLTYDENYYLIQMNGVRRFLIDKRAVDDLANYILKL